MVPDLCYARNVSDHCAVPVNSESGPEDEALLAAYGATLWLVAHPEQGDLPLRLEQRFQGVDLLPAAILTAYNPRSELRSEHENAAANQQLAAALAATGTPCLPTIAHGTGAETKKWDEPGFCASGIPLPVAIDLAARFDQNALVWVGVDAVPVLIATRDGFLKGRTGQRLFVPINQR
ncbi:hypothetical protein BH23GEM6_BH23GEM6_08060 [soil metagenome]